VTVPGEPNLYEIPPGLSPTYRPLPLPLQAAVWLASCVAVAALDALGGGGPRKTLPSGWLAALVAAAAMPFSVSRSIAPPSSLPPVRSLALFAAKVAAVALAACAVAQDRFFAPSRVPLGALLREGGRYHLPSRLSRFDARTGAHYLEYRADGDGDDDGDPSDPTGRRSHGAPTRGPLRYRALYANHGFGASSLSFLPALPAMAERLRCRVALGHDAPGFGLTQRRAAAAAAAAAPAPALGGSASAASRGGEDAAERRRHLDRYTFRGSAELGWELLRPRLGPGGEEAAAPTGSADGARRGDPPTAVRGGGGRDSGGEGDSGLPVLLLGHSMGAISTLHMALRVPPRVPVDVVLVAPALGIRRGPGRAAAAATASRRSQRGAASTAEIAGASNASVPLAGGASPAASSLTTRAGSAAPQSPARALVRPLVVAGRAVRAAAGSAGRAALRYALKRAVGRPGFWKRGLRLAWGDPASVTDADALRFQWPSVVEGWEQGLLDFAAAQRRRGGDRDHDDECDDAELLERVLRRPRTRVAVVLGTRDRVVPRSRVRRFFAKYPSVACLEMDGLGHDPFEENVAAFVALVDGALSAPGSGPVA
jgi:pimeloyl-ACP methyl ester carboxylesterase